MLFRKKHRNEYCVSQDMFARSAADTQSQRSQLRSYMQAFIITRTCGRASHQRLLDNLVSALLFAKSQRLVRQLRSRAPCLIDTCSILGSL